MGGGSFQECVVVVQVGHFRCVWVDGGSLQVCVCEWVALLVIQGVCVFD